MCHFSERAVLNFCKLYFEEEVFISVSQHLYSTCSNLPTCSLHLCSLCCCKHLHACTHRRCSLNILPALSTQPVRSLEVAQTKYECTNKKKRKANHKLGGSNSDSPVYIQSDCFIWQEAREELWKRLSVMNLFIYLFKHLLTEKCVINWPAQNMAGLAGVMRTNQAANILCCQSSVGHIMKKVSGLRKTTAFTMTWKLLKM